MANSGYILESRTILDSEIWKKPPLYFKVWHYLLLNAQHKDHDGLKRGELFTSIDEIRESCAYYVGYRKMMPSRKEVWCVLDWLRNPCEGNNESNNKGNMIKTTKVTHGMVVSVVNYGLYQDPTSYEGNKKPSTKGTAKEQRSGRQGNNNNKNDKNDKNDIYKTPLPPFDESASNVTNLVNTLNAKAHPETDFLKAHKGLYNAIKDWMAYKDEKKPRSANHYGTQQGMSKFITMVVGRAKNHGEDAVKECIDLAISNNWMGVAWDKLDKNGGKRGGTDVIKEW